jgi:hypothetical protein
MPVTVSKSNLQPSPFRHLWGVTEPFEVAVRRFHKFGYSGIESHFGDATERRMARALFEDLGLQNIAMGFTQGHALNGHTVEAHLQSLEIVLSESLETAPVCINVHAGFDAWSETDALRFFEGALEQTAKLPVPVGFETHRGRALNTPWRTLAVLNAFPELRLTLDVSHWVLVCERLPTDQAAALERAANATVHIHARIGSEQAPQVSDPSAPECTRLLRWYEALWRSVWDAQAARGEATSTFTPEFGPPDYQPTLPYTRAPLADLEIACTWMTARQLEQFNLWKAS